MLVNKRLVLTSFSLGLFFEMGHKVSVQSYMDVDLGVRERDFSFLKDLRPRDLPEARTNPSLLSLLAHIPSFHAGTTAPIFSSSQLQTRSLGVFGPISG